MLEKRNNFYPVIAAGLLVFLIFRLTHQEPKKDMIMVNGVAISRAPCLSEINALFEGRVDSNKACDCMLPAYYEMFKNDPAELTQLNQGDMHALSAAAKDSLYILFTHCVGPYVLDTTFKMHLSGTSLASFRAHLARKLRSKSKFDGTNPDSLASCIIDRLNGNITIPEFIGDGGLNDSTIQQLTDSCLSLQR